MIELIKFGRVLRINMFRSLLGYLKENGVRNLYMVNIEKSQKLEIYSLTGPILQPEEIVTSFFDKPSYKNLSPEEQLVHKLTKGRKSNGFGETFHRNS